MASPSDDLKYLSKYKDLKQRVRDIELDNDRLQLKVLKTKKNIHRLRIERAILYERLSTMPNAPPEAQFHPPRQAVFSSPEIQAQMDQRRHLEAAHRAHPPPAPHLPPHPPSPPRLHPLPPIHAPLDGPHRSRHPRDTDRLPASLPPPPPALPFPSRPGLPPMRTRHSDPSRPSSSHGAYAHPLQHPFMSPDDRAWERERHGNGYREERRYDPEPPSNGLPDSYTRTRRASHSHADPSSSSARWENPPPPPPPQGYHQYDYRAQDAELAESRRRGYPEMASELLDPAFERHRPPGGVPQKRRRTEDEVPRVQEGEAMD